MITERMQQLAGITESKEAEKFADKVGRILGNDYTVYKGAYTMIGRKNDSNINVKLTEVNGVVRVFVGLVEIYKGNDAKKAAQIIAKELS